MTVSSRCLYPDKSVPLGRGWRSSPLVFSLIPRCHWLYGSAKKIRIASRMSQALMLGHLLAPIVRQGLPQQSGHVLEFLREAIPDTPRIRLVRFGQEDQACRPLHQGTDSRSIASPLDQVAIPVAGHRAGRDFGGALGHRRHTGKSGPVEYPAPKIGVPCAPDAVPSTVRSAACRVVAHTGPHRWSRPTAICAYRQDTRV